MAVSLIVMSSDSPQQEPDDAEEDEDDALQDENENQE